MALNNKYILKLAVNRLKDISFQSILDGNIHKKYIEDLSYSEVKLLHSRLTDANKKSRLKQCAKEIFPEYNSVHFVDHRRVKYITI